MDLSYTYEANRHGVTAEEVFIDWPFLTEALDNAEEDEADLIQEALELSLMDDSEASAMKLGFAVRDQVIKYIKRVKAAREE